MFRFFENLVNPFQRFDETTPPKSLWPYIRTQIAPFKKWMVWMALTGILVAIVETGLIFYTGRVIDLMNTTEASVFWTTHGVELTFAVVFIIILRPLIITLNHLFLEQTLAGNMQEQVRWRAHKHLLGQSSTFFQNDFAGRLANRVMQLGAAVEDSIYMFFEGIWYAVTYVVGAIIILAQMDIRLALPLGIWLLVYVGYVRFIARRVSVASEKWSDARSLVTGRVVDAYSNIESVKLFAHSEGEERYVLSAMRRLRLRFQRFLRLMTELSLGLNLINGLLITGVLGMAVWLWAQGEVTVGQVAAASALTIRLNGMSGWIMWVTIRLFEHMGVIREGLRSVAVAHSVVDAVGAPDLAISKGEIEFCDVSHHYGRGSGGLDHVSIRIPQGQKVGLIGRSGAGKSSLVNLLLRFRDAEQGQILIDGQDVGAVTQDSLRRNIGMVTQDSSLLHRSVRANILYGKPDASEAQMIEACARAEAEDFIADLSDPQGRTGYNAHVASAA